MQIGNLKNFRLLAVVFSMACLLIACGDDVVEGGDNTREAGNDGQCPFGYELNPITQECQPTSSSNGETGNGETGNGETGNGETGNSETGNSETGNSETGNGFTPGECGLGAIEGQACRPDETALGGAQVTVTGVDCDTGQSFTMTTTADENGIYTFDDVPAGQHTVEIESGSFSGDRQVTVEAGQTARLLADGAKLCVSGDSANIAVIQGQWDDVGALLDGMGIDYDLPGGGGGMFDDLLSSGATEFFQDLDAMMDYSIIFVECGAPWAFSDPFGDFFGGGGGADEALIRSNLRQFVESGRSLYVSDQAQVFIQEALSETVNFHNESAGAGGPRIGTGSQTVDVDVVSPEMQMILPAGTTSIYFDTGGWVVAEPTQPAGSMIHFRADTAETGEGTLTDIPLMVSHNAVNNGRVIFTAFHNSAQATGEMQEILEFMIFQL